MPDPYSLIQDSSVAQWTAARQKPLVDDLGAFLRVHDLILTNSQPEVTTPGGDRILEGNVQVLNGLACSAQVYLQKDADWFIACFQPRGDWNFGKCFPNMQGMPLQPAGLANPATPAHNNEGTFLLCNVSLSNPLWVYFGINASAADKTTLANALNQLSFWKNWNEPEKNTLINELDDLGKQSSLYLWGNFPTMPDALHEALTALNQKLGQTIIRTEVFRPAKSLAEQQQSGQVNTFLPGFPVLRLELPLAATSSLFGTTASGELDLILSAPLYYQPGNSFIGLKGDVKLDIGDTNQLELSLELDYPLDGDVIRAIGKLKDSSTIPFADPSLFPNGRMPAAQSLELDLILLFSKASGKLKSVEFDVEMEDWELFDNKLKLGDLRFSFLVYDPTGMKAVMASIDATALIGAAPDQIEFSCGGAYPGGQLYLEIRSGANLAKVFKGLGISVSGHDPGLLDLLIRDMRVEYNVRSGQFYAGIDLEGPLTIHWFTLRDFQFHISKGSADWSLGISAAIGLGDIPLELSASFGSQGQWAFFARAFDIPLGKVLLALNKEFNSDISLPDQIKDLMVNTLSLSFNKGGSASGSSLDFLFTCEAKYPQDGGKADLTLTIHFSTEKIASGNPNAKPPQGSATPAWSNGTMNFSVEAILKIDGKSFVVDLEMAKGAQPGSSTDVLIAQNKDKVAFDLKSFLQLVSGDRSLADTAPSVEVVIDNLILAYVKSVDQQGNPVSKYLFGINLDLDLQLSHLPVAGKAFSGNEGIQNLQFIFATQHLTQAEVQTINTDLAKFLIPALPEASSPGAAPSPPANAAGASPVAFSKGLHVGATLNLGTYTKVFAFATGGGAPANVGNPAPAPGATPGAIPQEGNAASPSGAPGTGMIARRPSTAAGTWIDIQQTIGPFTLERVGANYQDKMFWFMLSASFSSAGLTVGLDGLGIGAPIEGFSLDKVRAKLSGMNLTYQGGPIEISGGFLEVKMPTDPNDPNGKPRVGYAGEALIKADPFSLSAMGLYTTVYSAAQQKTEDSLFIFAMLDLPLGGPPPFFVTGLAGGFGYNSELNLPPIGQLNQYLLVQGALPPPPSGNPFGGMPNNPGSVLDKLMAQSQGGRADVEPMAGEDWLGVGLRFTSFEMIKSFALLTVSFGSRFEIALLGRSQIAVPTNVDKPIAFAEVDLEAVFIPDATGNTPILAVDAKLAYGSFIFDTSCRLVGGFAFYIWSSGDFVVTFGGYHPHFDVPALYPREERVGFVWQLSSVLLIKGGIYFALTPSALMAGGGLSAVFQAGPIKAWFNAQADFLISWKPFHYEILIAIQLGVSADLGLFSINIHLGVGLQLWGPPFGGVATVDLSIISFSIHFGAAVALPPRLNWDEFSNSFLPDEESIFSGKISKGLLKTVDEYGWVVDPSHFEIATNSSVPFTQALSGSNADPGNAFLVNSWTTQLGILPMGEMQLGSIHYLDIKKKSEESADYGEYEGANRLAFEPILADAPKAVWSPLGLDDPKALQKSRLEKETMIGQAMVGIRIRPGVMHPDQTQSVLVKNLLFEDDLPPVGCTGFYSSPVASSVQAASNAPAWSSIDQALLESLKAEGFALPESA